MMNFEFRFVICDLQLVICDFFFTEKFQFSNRYSLFCGSLFLRLLQFTFNILRFYISVIDIQHSAVRCSAVRYSAVLLFHGFTFYI